MIREETQKRKFNPSNLLWLGLLVILLWWALRNAPLPEIWESLRQLKLWQIAALIAVNTMIFSFMTLRWWLIVRAENKNVPFWPLMGYRLSAFGLSYFTPGPQVGGEPLQVIYLQRKYGLTFARSTAAVFMDKLLEFLANFIFLAVGVVAIFRVGLVSGVSLQAFGSLTALAVLLLWPLIHIVLLHHRRFPLSSLLRAIQSRFGNNRFLRLMIVSERMAAAFTRRHLRALLSALGVSLLWWLGMVLEYILMLNFLNINLDLWQTLAALAAALLAFLVPVPAGLGALEASQVFVIGALGHPAAAGIGLSLLVRGRDILFGGLGLLLASRGIGVKSS